MKPYFSIFVNSTPNIISADSLTIQVGDTLKHYFNAKDLNDDAELIYSIKTTIDELLFSGKKGNKKSNPKRLLFLEIIVLIIAIGIWAASGFYQVQPGQQAALQWLGKFDSVQGTGLHLLQGVGETLSEMAVHQTYGPVSQTGRRMVRYQGENYTWAGIFTPIYTTFTPPQWSNSHLGWDIYTYLHHI